MSWSCVANGLDILNDRWAVGRSITQRYLYWKHEPEHTLSRSSYESKNMLAKAKPPEERDVRFPWSQSNDPDSFQSLKAWPWMNHKAVPSWWASLAVLKFIDGSGGESQLRRSCRIWFPTRSMNNGSQQRDRKQWLTLLIVCILFYLFSYFVTA